MTRRRAVARRRAGLRTFDNAGPDFDPHLKVTDFFVVDVAPDFGHLEPVESIEGLRCTVHGSASASSTPSLELPTISDTEYELSAIVLPVCRDRALPEDHDPNRGATPYPPSCQAPGLASSAASAGPHDPLA